MVIKQQVQTLVVQQAWLLSLRYMQIQLAKVEFLAGLLVKEPVTKAEHRRLTDKAAAEYVPVKQLATRLVELERAWSDEDLRYVEWADEHLVQDEAWQRLEAEAEQRLRACANAGLIEANGKGAALALRRGSFEEWLGRKSGPLPEWGLGFDVRDDAGSVARDQHTFANLKEALLSSPFNWHRLEKAPTFDDFVQIVEERVRHAYGLRWTDVATVEWVVDRIADEFEGEDPLKPANRESLVNTRQALEDSALYFQVYGPEPERPEPSEEDKRLAVELVGKGRRLFTMLE